MKDEPARVPWQEGGVLPPPSSALTHLSWPQVRKALDADPRLILPVGALAQHGPHLPLGTNTLIAEAVAREVARDTGILLAPTFHYGVRGPEREEYAGSAGLQRKTLHRALNELLAEWEDHGVEEFVLLTAHRHEPHLDALLMALTSSSRTTVVNLFAVDVGDLLEGDPLSEHAGELETSLMLYLAPDRVRADAIRDVIPDRKTLRRYARGRVPTPPPDSRGALGSPSLATPLKGEAAFLRYIRSVQEVLSGADSQP